METHYDLLIKLLERHKSILAAEIEKVCVPYNARLRNKVVIEIVPFHIADGEGCLNTLDFRIITTTAFSTTALEGGD